MPVDIIPLAGMLFSLLVVLVIGGFILLFPVTRRLGQLIEMRLEERRGGALPSPELEELRRTIEAVQSELARLAERQQFTERLLERGESRREPSRSGE